jgi:probable phosphoglycerate mutase
VTLLAVLRHAPTDWNAAGRLQGRTDLPLSAAGREAARLWRITPDQAGWHWLTSRLLRARETARLMGLDAAVEPALVEMSWGAWEGRRLDDLRRSDPAGMAALEAQGLDLMPPEGESPRQVQARLRPLLARLAVEGIDTGAVTHKGVLRALLSLATGWDMGDKPPVKLAPASLHLFRLAPDGTPHLEQPNISLIP